MSIGINVVKLFSSNMAGQVLIVLTTPLVTRLFSPRDFGRMQILEAVAAVLFCIAGLKYELAIPLGRNQQEANAACILSLFFTSVIALIGFLGILLGDSLLVQWFHAPELSLYFRLLPATLLLYGGFTALVSWASREGRFGAIAWAGFGSLVGDRGLTLCLGYVFGTSLLGLFLGRVAGLALYGLILAGFLGRSLWVNLIKTPLSLSTILSTAEHYKALPLLKTWNVLITTISLQLLAFIFGHYFPHDVVGHSSLALKVVTLPATVLGVAIAQVFFPAASQEFRESGTLSSIVTTMFTRLVQISAFPMAVIGFFGPTLFQFAFGAQWGEAGEYARLFGAWQFLVLLSFPMDVFTILNRQDIGLYLVIFGLVGRTASLVLGVKFGAPHTAIGIFVLFSVLLLAGTLGLQLRFSNVSGRWACHLILQYASISCALLLPVKALETIAPNAWLVISALALSTLGFCVVVYTIDPSVQQFILTRIATFRRSSCKYSSHGNRKE